MLHEITEGPHFHSHSIWTRASSLVGHLLSVTVTAATSGYQPLTESMAKLNVSALFDEFTELVQCTCEHAGQG